MRPASPLLVLALALWAAMVGPLKAAPETAPSAQASRPAPAPLAAFGRLPSVADVVLSPSGARIAAILHDGDTSAVQVRDVNSRAVVGQMNTGAAKIRSLAWADDDHLIVTRSSTAELYGMVNPRAEYAQGFEMDLLHHKARPLMENTWFGNDSVEALNVIYGPPIIVHDVHGVQKNILTGESFLDHRGVLTLFEDGVLRTKVVIQGNPETADFAVSPAGNVIGRIDYDQVSGKWRVLAGSDQHGLKTVRAGVSPFGQPGFAGVSGDGKRIYIWPAERDRTGVSVIDVAAGTWSDASGIDRVSGLIVQKTSQIVLGYFNDAGDQTTCTFLDKADDQFWKAVVKAFPGVAVGYVSMSSDRSKLMVDLYGGDWGYSLAMVDRKTGAAKFYADVYAGIEPTDISVQKLIHYKAADGMDIPAYLTLPNGRPARALPLIVLPHGGPFARDNSGFDWWSQALASRGYAVLQPQFRGSEGFGQAHLEAGYGEYGRKMQTDLSDGVAELARQGLIDPGRVAITGTSYGGYAALAGVTLQSGIYRCAASVAGPSDMRRHQAYLREKYNGETRTAGLRYWREFLGVKSDNDPALDAISPAFNADKAAVPLMLIHGRDDTVVPIDQSRRMEAALKKAGKAVTLVELKGEDHWLSRGDTRLQMLASSVSFLEACNPPDPPRSN